MPWKGGAPNARRGTRRLTDADARHGAGATKGTDGAATDGGRAQDDHDRVFRRKASGRQPALGLEDIYPPSEDTVPAQHDHGEERESTLAAYWQPNVHWNPQTPLRVSGSPAGASGLSHVCNPAEASAFETDSVPHRPCLPGLARAEPDPTRLADFAHFAQGRDVDSCSSGVYARRGSEGEVRRAVAVSLPAVGLPLVPAGASHAPSHRHHGVRRGHPWFPRRVLIGVGAAVWWGPPAP